MKDKNTMTKREFILHHLLIGVGLLGWFRAFIFISLPLVSSGMSEFLFLLFYLVGVIIGLIICWNKRRNYLALMVNILGPMGLYTIYAYSDLCLRIICLFLALVMISWATYFVMMRILHTRKQRRGSTYYRYILLGQRTICVCFLSLLMITIGVMGIDGTIPLEKYDYTLEKNERIAERVNELDLIKSENWDKADYQNRIQFCESIIDIEMKAAHMQYKPKLRIQVMDNPYVLGLYSGHETIISVSYSLLMSDDVLNVVETLLHECRHAQQYYIAKKYEENHGALVQEEKDMAKLFSDNFQNYKSAKDDGYDAYDSQLLERDADAYALENIFIYIEEISKGEQADAL